MTPRHSTQALLKMQEIQRLGSMFSLTSTRQPHLRRPQRHRTRKGAPCLRPAHTPFLASYAGVAREKARAETALHATAFVRSLEYSVGGEQSRGDDSAFDAQIAATDAATAGQEADNVQPSAGGDGSGSERDFDLS